MSVIVLTRSNAHAFAQALITGRVVEAGTNPARAPSATVQLTLLDRGVSPPVELNLASLGLALQQRPDGSFAYWGDPLRVFTETDRTIQYTWRVEARAEGYDLATEDFDVGPLGSQPQAVTFAPPMLEGDVFEVSLFRGGGLPVELAPISLTLSP